MGKPEQEWREEFVGVVEEYASGSEAEKKLVRKIDFRIVSEQAYLVASEFR